VCAVSHKTGKSFACDLCFGPQGQDDRPVLCSGTDEPGGRHWDRDELQIAQIWCHLPSLEGFGTECAIERFLLSMLLLMSELETMSAADRAGVCGANHVGLPHEGLRARRAAVSIDIAPYRTNVHQLTGQSVIHIGWLRQPGYRKGR
jgi:hypothetical protein